jgi:hypothetical protein
MDQDPAVTAEGPDRRWMGVGSAAHGDPETAARGALATALRGPDPRLVVLFGSVALDLPRVAAAVDDALGGGVPVVGCSSAGEISTDGSTTAGLVVVALGGPGFEVATGVAVGDATDGLRQAASEAARCLDRLPSRRRHTALVLLADGLCGDQMELVRGAYQIAGAAVPLVGACAGDDLAMERTLQVHGRDVLTNAVVAAAISSDRPLGVGVRHGCVAEGDPMLVTATEGVDVLTLDDRPALDAFLDRFDAPPEVRTDPVAFADFALTRPLGIRRRDRIELRYVAGADFGTRALHCIAEVPQGALAWLMRGDRDAVLEATDQACADAVGALDGEQPLGLVVFDCVARRAVLTDAHLAAEVARMSAAAGDAPIGGCYTYGEIARTSGAGGFHNQTLVVLAVA